MPASDSPPREAPSPPDPSDPREDDDAVAVVRKAGTPAAELLDQALAASGFWTLLAARVNATGRSQNELSIAIKPDLDVVEVGSPAGTDPELVEALIARLREEGYAQVVVCDGRNRSDPWLLNRDAYCVPDLVGYTFEAPAGRPYEVAWVDDQPRGVPIHAPSGAAAADAGEQALQVNRAWVDADVRITFGAAKTDDTWGYALTVQNLLGLVSSAGTAARWSPEDRCLHILRHVPPHFAILDAVVSSHGSAGAFMPRPLATDTVIASASSLLVDWVAALKMGQDPYDSPINRLALERLGAPGSWSLVGDTAPWNDWKNPAPTLLEAGRVRARWPALDELVRAVVRPTDRERFPFRAVLLDQLNATVVEKFEGLSDAWVREAVLGLAATLLAWVARARNALAYTVSKGRIARSEAPLTLDLGALDARAYDETRGMVEGYARVLEGAPTDPRGFRIRTIGGHIHFAASRVLPLDFDDFVARVDVAASIRYMNDYLGGSFTVVEADAAGRPVRQAERNVYLPQPNWVGVFGGQEIDVEKVERIAYEKDAHTIWWRTLNSPNDSADSDDGSVVFARTPAGQVEVRIFARQRFRLPASVASARVERWPGVHGPLVSEAYGSFFDGTLSNLRAAYAGEPFRIGAPARGDSDPDHGDVYSVAAGAMAFLNRVLGWTTNAPPAAATDRATTADGHTATPGEIDELGFAHFPGFDAPGHFANRPGWQDAAGGGQELTPLTFLTELGQAVGRDLAAASAAASPLAGLRRRGSDAAGAPGEPEP